MAEVSEGHYSKKQLSCKSWVIAWSHGSRYHKGVALVGSNPGGQLLDYGCGDGTFLSLVAGKFGLCMGSDIAVDQIEDCQRRFAAIPNTRFCTVRDLVGPEHDHAYHIVTCMETLEHCINPIADQVLADLKRLCRPDGKVIISVPIEIGPTFFFKYPIRKVAAWRGLSDYRHYENYSLADATRMVFATKNTVVVRPVYGKPGDESHSHYGFNWRWLRQRVKETFHIERTLFTPLGFLGGWFCSQAWFICRPSQ